MLPTDHIFNLGYLRFSILNVHSLKTTHVIPTIDRCDTMKRSKKEVKKKTTTDQP